MPVYANMEWLAVRSTGVNRTVQHFDLVRLPDGTGGYAYGIFSQVEGAGGIWKETFDAAEALIRLQAWVHEERSPTQRPQSQVTEAGRRWLAEHST